MPLLLLVSILLATGEALAPAPGEIQLTIAQDPYTSSDQVTLCRVRAVNYGSRTWPGSLVRFEARAAGTQPVIRQRGRFGLELPPHGSLETLIALPGRHARLEVELLSAKLSGEAERKTRSRTSRHKSRKPKG